MICECSSAIWGSQSGARCSFRHKADSFEYCQINGNVWKERDSQTAVKTNWWFSSDSFLIAFYFVWTLHHYYTTSHLLFFTLLGFSHAYYWPVFTVTNDMLSLFLWATVTGHTRQSGSESGWQKEECNFYNQHVTFLRQSICLDLDPALALSHSFMHRRSLLPL